MREFLRRIPLFSELSDEDLGRLCDIGHDVHLAAGEVLFYEGSSGDTAYVIQNGLLEILKKSGNREVLLAVRKEGEVIGELALVEDRARMATVRARCDSLLFTIDGDQMLQLIRSSPTAAETMFLTMLSRWQSTESLLRHSEKMAHLGTLAAGVAHELNNPAAAVRRGATHLETALESMGTSLMQLTRMQLNDKQQVLLYDMTERARVQAALPPSLDPLARSDRELELEEWLEERETPNAWELAPIMVNLNLDDGDLADFADAFPAGDLAAIVGWLNANYETFNLMAEIGQGAERVSQIVKALKNYSYLDQAPVQSIDIHDGLDNTLLILKHKLHDGIVVKRDYASNLPQIEGYGSELNQVWTNILDNAIDALGEEGEITIHSRLEGKWVIVDIVDNGPGIPPEIQSRIFEPFFTTKAPGAGTGLGLDISYNIVVQKHRGDLELYSEPGNTRFEIRLPINFEEVQVSA